MEKICLVCNKESSHANPSLIKKLAKKYFNQKSIQYVFSSRQTYIVERVKKYLHEGCRFFIVAGGDGTLSRVADVIVETDATMAILPMGTANAVAETLDIDDDIEQDMKLLANEEYDIIAVDTLKVDDQYFLLNLTIGLTSKVADNTSSLSKKIFGKASYVLHGIYEFLKHSSLDITVKINGTSHEFTVIELIVHNLGLQRISFFNYVATAGPTSGFAECYMFTMNSVREYALFLFDYLTRRVSTNRSYLKHIIIRDKLSIYFAGDVPFQGDGDSFTTKKLDIEVMPQSLRIALIHRNQQGD